MVPKTRLMMIVGGIILVNVSFKGPSISFLAKLNHSMRYKL